MIYVLEELSISLYYTNSLLQPSIESICLPPVRYGSLDSLHEVHGFSQSSPSPSQQRGVPGDVSDDG